MSEQVNERWVEAAYENFQEAVENEDITLAKSIIADTQELGFKQEAQIMNAELRQATEEKAL